MAKNLNFVRRKNPKGDSDFYPTPPGVVKALLEVELFGGTIWEPACGEGHISRVLEERGKKVISTDLIDRGYGKGGVDFFRCRRRIANDIITNPPFTLGQRFFEHAMDLGIFKMALLLKLVFLEGMGRSISLEKTPLKRVWVFRERVTFSKNSVEYGLAGMLAFAWFVWEKDYNDDPTIGWVSTRNKKGFFH